ncbi:hypothetical protein GCM10010219_12790 [Streptomyces netropsis]|nr:hypothetical protein GCM10010219_12790 [Streptomyces netropsis]
MAFTEIGPRERTPGAARRAGRIREQDRRLSGLDDDGMAEDAIATPDILRHAAMAVRRPTRQCGRRRGTVRHERHTHIEESAYALGPRRAVYRRTAPLPHLSD